MEFDDSERYVLRLSLLRMISTSTEMLASPTYSVEYKNVVAEQKDQAQALYNRVVSED